MQSELTTPEAAVLARPSRFTSTLVVVLWTATVLSQAGIFIYLLPVKRFRDPAGMDASLQMSDLARPAFVLLIATFGALIVLRATERRFGWLMLAAGFSQAIVGFTTEYSQYALLVAPQANLPLGWLAAWLQDLWTISVVLLVFLLPVLFPDGKLPSRRWRAIFWPTMSAWTLFILYFAFAQRPLANAFLDFEAAPLNPFGILPGNTVLFNTAFAALATVSILTGMTSLISRWRGTRGEVRQQIKWVVYAFLLLLAILAVSLVDTSFKDWSGIDLGLEKIFDAAIYLSLLGLVAALGIAVLKYRLYDIDLLINRTLVYGVLTVIVVATYVFFVAGLGALLPLQNNLFLSLVATGVIAVLFNPLRERLQRLINRLMFGERDDPYVVLSRLGQRLMTTPAPEATLHTITETVATALKLPYAAIRLQQGDKFVTRAEYGTSAAEGIALDLVYQNEVVGKFVVAPRAPGEPLAPKDRQLLEDIAHQASAVAHAVRLTSDLQRSRQRLVTAREEERRRLRRDLHDGLGPTLASHTLKLDTAMDLIHGEPDAAIEQLQQLYGQTQEIVADIRRLVHQLRPPALDDLGLVGAVRAHIQHSRRTGNRLQVAVDASPEELPPLPAAVELAAYRITMEAVTNAIRHARAEHCQVRFHLVNGLNRRLQIQINDNGQGLPRQLRHGVGMTSMRERAQELGGWVRIEAGEGGGTQVCAELPLPEDRST